MRIFLDDIVIIGCLWYFGYYWLLPKLNSNPKLHKLFWFIFICFWLFMIIWWYYHPCCRSGPPFF